MQIVAARFEECRSVIVQILSDTILLFDTICKRSVSFMKNCLNSRSDVVSYVAKFGVYFGHQNSVFGRNGSFCFEYFSLNVNDLMCGNVSKWLLHNICLGRRTEESYCNAIGVFELLMLKCNILAIPGCDFTVRDIDLLIQSMCNDLC